MAGDGQLTFSCVTQAVQSCDGADQGDKCDPLGGVSVSVREDRSQISDVSEFERAPEFFFSVNNCISGHVVFQALKWSAEHAWRLSQHF